MSAAAPAMAAPAAVAHAAATNPTRAQIQRAVRRAEGSRSLWATVNICDTRRYPNTLGVRGQMPSLGFPAWLSMNIQLNSFSAKRGRFVRISGGGTTTIRLGRSSLGLQQDGATFAFKRHAGLFDATIQFVWRRSGRLLGQTTRRTTGGHRNADFGSPPRYSAGECRIR
ncbi:MAG: hypothetical protein ACR2MK_10610 [Solirubrobacteraceae bacterium]